MKVAFTIIGAVLGVVVELVFPWSQIVMEAVNNLLNNESTYNYVGLPELIRIFGIFVAYLMLPLALGGLGLAFGSRRSSR